MFKRTSFYSLDGVWGLNGDFIEVPFPKESLAGGYPHKEKEDELRYMKCFILPEDFLKDGQRLILHFGAVDQICEVYLNDVLLGRHEGGYLPFAFDISEHLKTENVLTVIAKDDLNDLYPYGKQSKDPHGMWYTPVSGIWGSVWLEAVPAKNRIEEISVDTTMDKIHLEIVSDASWFKLKIDFDEGTYENIFNDNVIDIDLNGSNVKYRNWSPADPALYDFTLETEDDKISSYLALRELSVEKVNGYQRIFFNGRPLFLNGVLDQGYFEDGIYLPKDPKEYQSDIRRMKELGFNMLRKHIKVEPDVFYYYCDKEGMLVMQDMVNSGPFHTIKDTVFPTIGFVNKDDTKNVDEKRYDFFIEHSLKTIKLLRNHPCIMAWTIYNEGWGQQRSSDAYALLKKADPNRIFDTASGWFKPNDSDIDSYHVYFRNKVLKAKDKDKVLLLSEFGGYVRKIEGHIFTVRKANYGYGTKDSEEALSSAIEEAYQKMVIPSIKYGLCGCIYTQVSDVEEEVNGLYTYDRQICKVDKEVMRSIRKLVDEAYEKETLRKED